MGQNVESLRSLIVGAGEAARITIEKMISGAEDVEGIPAVAVDDDESRIGQNVAGVPIVGTTAEIPRIVEESNIQQIIFAIPSAPRDARLRIFDACMQTDARLITLPRIMNVPARELDRFVFSEVDVADLLSRDEVALDIEALSAQLKGKTVLVTGGGGSIGSELCRQIVSAAPARLVIFDIYENTTYELLRELLDEDASCGNTEIVVHIGSVTDEACIEKLFSTYEPSWVFHAAAHKHVPLMENNEREAVINNVLGTWNVAKAAHDHHAERFVFISTDKAVNPTSVMGATKRLGEMIVMAFGAKSETIFSAVRFGNVLGSHGSVIPLFEKQIKRGGPITVTDKSITRYFMTIPEAARLVVSSALLSAGSEIYILDMGDPVRIYDLAERLVVLHGFTPNVTLDIEITGLRPGEKMYEELSTESENLRLTENGKIYVCETECSSFDDVRALIEKIRSMQHTPDNGLFRELLIQTIEAYNPA